MVDSSLKIFELSVKGQGRAEMLRKRQLSRKDARLKSFSNK